MAEHLERGKDGEDLAAEYLRKQGMTIVKRNWRIGHKEVDIIAVTDDDIVFVEVKTRKNEPIHPSDVVSRDKMKNLISAANAYIKYNKIDRECRFDVIILTGDNGSYDINHIPNAFRPYGRR